MLLENGKGQTDAEKVAEVMNWPYETTSNDRPPTIAFTYSGSVRD